METDLALGYFVVERSAPPELAINITKLKYFCHTSKTEKRF